jgi:hypothetical protein
LKTSDAFELIVQIESSVDTDVFIWKGFNTWPLIRQILWVELTSTTSNDKISKKGRILEVSASIKKFVLAIYYSFSEVKISQDNTKIFISRPVYLQELHSEKYFDRIVDPIIELLDLNEKITKFYVSNVPNNKELMHEFLVMHQSFSFNVVTLTAEQKKTLRQIGRLSDFGSEELQERYKETVHSFINWFVIAKRMLSKQKKLKEIYLTSWYFSDMMGVCAAASELGIKTIDVQHGKQGKYQAMYSGWSKIPESGYALMPDNFWCWGQPSCDHILSSSPNRNTHIPFIGGYPWIDYYQKNLTSIDSQNINVGIRVLVTMQPPQGGNIERIPDFIIDFLSSNHVKNICFTFRLHPNDAKGKSYCVNRLSLIDPYIYNVDPGKSNLYDAFIKSTHHITAYSSCCYEANVFSVPTLLFGSEAKDIYKDDIKSGIFSWTNGSASDLEDWLCIEQQSKQKISSYIEVKK